MHAGSIRSCSTLAAQPRPGGLLGRRSPGGRRSSTWWSTTPATGCLAEFETTSAADWQAQIDAMLGATLRITHAAYRGMRERNKGCLVNVSSLAAEFPLPFMSGYNVAKAGLSALSESLLFESRGSAVSVIDFRPGDYRTSFNQAMRRNPRSAAGLRPAASRLARP